MQYSYQAVNQSSSIGTSGISNLSSSIVLLTTETGEGMGSQGNKNFSSLNLMKKNKKKINPTKAVPHLMNSLMHHYSRISMQAQFYEATDDD